MSILEEVKIADQTISLLLFDFGVLYCFDTANVESLLDSYARMFHTLTLDPLGSYPQDGLLQGL